MKQNKYNPYRNKPKNIRNSGSTIRKIINVNTRKSNLKDKSQPATDRINISQALKARDQAKKITHRDLLLSLKSGYYSNASQGAYNRLSTHLSSIPGKGGYGRRKKSFAPQGQVSETSSQLLKPNASKVSYSNKTGRPSSGLSQQSRVVRKREKETKLRKGSMVKGGLKSGASGSRPRKQYKLEPLYQPLRRKASKVSRGSTDKMLPNPSFTGKLGASITSGRHKGGLCSPDHANGGSAVIGKNKSAQYSIGRNRSKFIDLDHSEMGFRSKGSRGKVENLEEIQERAIAARKAGMLAKSHFLYKRGKSGLKQHRRIHTQLGYPPSREKLRDSSQHLRTSREHPQNRLQRPEQTNSGSKKKSSKQLKSREKSTKDGKRGLVGLKKRKSIGNMLSRQGTKPTLRPKNASKGKSIKRGLKATKALIRKTGMQGGKRRISFKGRRRNSHQETGRKAIKPKKQDLADFEGYRVEGGSERESRVIRNYLSNTGNQKSALRDAGSVVMIDASWVTVRTKGTLGNPIKPQNAIKEEGEVVQDPKKSNLNGDFNFDGGIIESKVCDEEELFSAIRTDKGLLAEPAPRPRANSQSKKAPEVEKNKEKKEVLSSPLDLENRVYLESKVAQASKIDQKESLITKKGADEYQKPAKIENDEKDQKAKIHATTAPKMIRVQSEELTGVIEHPQFHLEKPKIAESLLDISEPKKPKKDKNRHFNKLLCRMDHFYQNKHSRWAQTEDLIPSKTKKTQNPAPLPPMQKSPKNPLNELTDPAEAKLDASKISLDVKMGFSTIKPQQIEQNIPFTVNLKETFFDANDIKIETKVDLVCVIDTSSSMFGEKIEFVKKSMVSLLDVLPDGNRIAIILFNYKASLYLNFKLVNQKNRPKIIEAIEGIQPLNGTNLVHAMSLMQALMLKRRSRNSVTACFLLSDGAHNQGPLDLDILFGAEPEGLEEYTVSTFGYGESHNPKILQNIAELKKGSYYYIDDISKVKECFLDNLAIVTSILAKNLEIEVKLTPTRLFPEIRFERVYGPYWSLEDNLKAKLKFFAFYAGFQKHLVAKLRLNPVERFLVEEAQELEIGSVTLTMEPLGDLRASLSQEGSPDRPITLKKRIVLRVVPEDSPEPIRKNKSVIKQMMRVRGAGIIQKTEILKGNGKIKEARRLIEKYLRDLNLASFKHKPLFLQVVNTMQKQKNMLEQATIKESTMFMMQTHQVFMNECSAPIHTDTLYQNKKQRMLGRLKVGGRDGARGVFRGGYEG